MNLILATDSYKLGHWKQYPSGTNGVYSYLEARNGAKFDKTVFFGLQHILKQLEGIVVTQEDIEEAAALAKAHFGTDELFNREGWEHIVKNWGGRLPVRIKAVAEGTPVNNGNVLMTVENTDSKCFWLTNALESLLLHVWYPTTVASLSYDVKERLANWLAQTGATQDTLPFMLHDFGYRGATTHDAAAIGGAGHLVNFLGTDTLPAMQLLLADYSADLNSLAFSVPATEHSVMTSLGRVGEVAVTARLFDTHPTGILSVVADSYNIYEFVDSLGTHFKDRVMERDGKFVVRPDSCTSLHATPEALVAHLLKQLWGYFGGTVNSKNFKVLDPHIGLIWGDGIDPDGIDAICAATRDAGFSVENLVFGMGGGLLQKINRDTQRFAFKCSAQKRNGVWLGVQKQPLDATKTSKIGRLRLDLDTLGNYETVPEDANLHDHTAETDILDVVFENGEIKRHQTFDDVRKRAM